MEMLLRRRRLRAPRVQDRATGTENDSVHRVHVSPAGDAGEQGPAPVPERLGGSVDRRLELPWDGSHGITRMFRGKPHEGL